MRSRPVANGLSTNHPIPDLPFVDDSHINPDDAAAVEAHGRRTYDGMWGRADRCPDGGWTAFTTDPLRNDLAWCVRWHPGHGRSVVLYRDRDAASVHTALWGPALLFRAGGYWWDGLTWYRPSQVWDHAAETFVRRSVPSATTISAADLLVAARDADPARAEIVSVIDVDPDASLPGRWVDHLALWANRRCTPDALMSGVVTLTAPELTPDQLVGQAELAEIAGVAASTLRAYVARGEADVPMPQAVVGRRPMWARTVAEEWAEQRSRSSDGVAAALAADRTAGTAAVGVDALWKHFSKMFFASLWDRADYRKRWSLRWRTEAAVRDVAEDLGWAVAASLSQILPMRDLAITIRDSFIRQVAIEVDRETAEPKMGWYAIDLPVAQMVGWMVRHDPVMAKAMIGEVFRGVQDQWQIRREVLDRTIEAALDEDHDLDEERKQEFLRRALPPRD